MSHSRLRISVVDDELPVRKALGRLLRTAGYEVETFASGPEFLDSLQGQHPHCTILDLHLPGMSGLEVHQQLNLKNGRQPCIIVTGKDEPGVEERVMASGASAYLKKPLDEQVILSAITAATQGCPRVENSPNSCSEDGQMNR